MSCLSILTFFYSGAKLPTLEGTNRNPSFILMFDLPFYSNKSSSILEIIPSWEPGNTTTPPTVSTRGRQESVWVSGNCGHTPTIEVSLSHAWNCPLTTVCVFSCPHLIRTFPVSRLSQEFRMSLWSRSKTDIAPPRKPPRLLQQQANQEDQENKVGIF